MTTEIDRLRAEIDRIRAEEDRIRAEEKKLLGEFQQLSDTMSAPWYRRGPIMKSLLAGVVAAGLLVVWVIGYFEPILSRGLEVERLENRRIQLSARYTADSARNVADGAMRAVDSIRVQVIQLTAALDSVSSTSSALAEDMGIPEEVREDYRDLARRTDSTTVAWQDNAFLFGVARVRLESYARDAATIALPDTITSVLHEFPDNSSSAQLQQSRLQYARTVILILSSNVDHEAAITIWLAGVEQHNRSLEFLDGAQAEAEEHLQEIEAIFLLLSNRAVRETRMDSETRDQVLSWLDIHRHNMEVMLD